MTVKLYCDICKHDDTTLKTLKCNIIIVQLTSSAISSAMLLLLISQKLGTPFLIRSYLMRYRKCNLNSVRFHVLKHQKGKSQNVLDLYKMKQVNSFINIWSAKWFKVKTIKRLNNEDCGRSTCFYQLGYCCYRR